MLICILSTPHVQRLADYESGADEAGESIAEFEKTLAAELAEKDEQIVRCVHARALMCKSLAGVALPTVAKLLWAR